MEKRVEFKWNLFLKDSWVWFEQKHFFEKTQYFLWTSKKKGGVNVGQQISHSFENEKKIKINVNSSIMCLVYMVNYLYIHFLVYGFIVILKLQVSVNYPTLSRITPCPTLPYPPYHTTAWGLPIVGSAIEKSPKNKFLPKKK